MIEPVLVTSIDEPQRPKRTVVRGDPLPTADQLD
jgi:hypothetical protein